MADRPILFSGPMVRALLDGRKTQTRRVIKDQPPTSVDHAYIRPRDPVTGAWLGACWLSGPIGRGVNFGNIAIRYAPGDRLWVRENGWERPERTPKMMRDGADTWEPFYYDADDLACFEHEQFKAWGFKRRPSIHMPRWASRLTLVVTDVRVQRLRDITLDDAIAEGIAGELDNGRTRVSQYRNLWNSLNASRGFGWRDNPWVVALTFTVHPCNIDAMEGA